MSLWERFNNIATVDEVEVAKAVYSPVEAGKYYAILNKIEAGESSSGLPMLKASFKLESGKKYPLKAEAVVDPNLILASGNKIPIIPT